MTKSDARLDRGERRIIRRRAVEQKTGLARSAIYEGIADGTFPRPVPLSTRAVGWIEEEVEAWIDGRIAERDLPRDQRPKPVRKRIRKRARRPAEAHAAA